MSQNVSIRAHVCAAGASRAAVEGFPLARRQRESLTELSSTQIDRRCVGVFCT